MCHQQENDKNVFLTDMPDGEVNVKIYELGWLMKGDWWEDHDLIN